MKNTSLVFLLISFFMLNICLTGKENSIKISPEKPKAGDEITVLFNPEGTQLAGSSNVQIYFSFYSFSSQNAENVECTHVWNMTKEGELWTTKLKTNDETNLVLVKFIDNDLSDNNDGLGYSIKINDKNGNETVYSDLGLASAYVAWGTYTKLVDRNLQKALEMFNRVFSAHPEHKTEFIAQYLAILKRTTPSGQLAEVMKKELEEFEKSSMLTERDNLILMNAYKDINMDDKAELLKEKLIRLFPLGSFSYSQTFKKLESEKDVIKIIALAKKMEKDFPVFDPYAISPSMQAFANLIKLGAYEKLNGLWEYISAKSNMPITYNWLANQLVYANKELELALKIIKQGEDACALEEKNPTQSNFRVMPDEWSYKLRNRDLYYVSNTYGKILNLLNRKKEAVEKYERALLLDAENVYEGDEYSDYFKLALELKKYDKAQLIAEKAIRKGLVLNEIDEVLKNSYIEKNKSEAGFKDYLDKLKESGKNAAIARQKKKMINQPAPQFTLTDLEGKNVSLADYKGKVVVVDFWATWCGPCKTSFPAMQKTIEKYKDDKDVVFLFVNTWQQETDKKTNAENFIKETKYTFHVLLDLENKVVADFKVSGIPTKFVIDRNGNIRFNVSGAETGDVAVQNLSSMIELAKK